MNRITMLLLAGLAAATITAGAVATDSADAQETDKPSGLVWLALGDSYSSGEGLRYIDQQANPSDMGCERATGRTSVNGGDGSRAYAKVAYDLVSNDWDGSLFELSACTGAVTDDLAAQYQERLLPNRDADIVTVSMGGNNLGFGSLVQECAGVSVEGGAVAAATGLVGFALLPNVGCTVSETEIRERILQLVNTNETAQGPFDSQTLPNMYRDLVDNAVAPGGHVFVLGYPNLIEESGRWSGWWFEGNRCSRISRADTTMLRSATGYLNERIAIMVDQLNADADLDAQFHWIDVSKIYESADGRHGLCTGEPWINGITAGTAGTHFGNVALRPQRSFHPNQKGHDAVGQVLEQRMREIEWDSYITRREATDRTTEDLLVGSGCGEVGAEQGVPLVVQVPGGDIPCETALETAALYYTDNSLAQYGPDWTINVSSCGGTCIMNELVPKVPTAAPSPDPSSLSFAVEDVSVLWPPADLMAQPGMNSPATDCAQGSLEPVRVATAVNWNGPSVDLYESPAKAQAALEWFLDLVRDSVDARVECVRDGAVSSYRSSDVSSWYEGHAEPREVDGVWRVHYDVGYPGAYGCEEAGVVNCQDYPVHETQRAIWRCGNVLVRAEVTASELGECPTEVPAPGGLRRCPSSNSPDEFAADIEVRSLTCIQAFELIRTVLETVRPQLGRSRFELAGYQCTADLEQEPGFNSPTEHYACTYNEETVTWRS